MQKATGFRIQFCPNTYPIWAIPESLLGDREPWDGRAPKGALGELMNAFVLVGWPQPVLEANNRSKAAAQSEALVARVRNPRTQPRELAPASNKPNGTVLREARLAAGLNQRSGAGVLGVSQSQLCKLETNQRPLPRNELNRYVEALEEHLRRERFTQARGGR